MRRWSVEEFYGLLRHDLTDSEGPVELIEGYIVPLPMSEQLTRQVERLRQQLQQYFDQGGFEGIEVRSHYPITLNQHSELRPTLVVLSPSLSPPRIHWVIEIDQAEPADYHPKDLRSRLYAHHGIAEYWHLSTEQVELRTHYTPAPLQPSGAIDLADSAATAYYVHQQLWHVGESVHPVAFPHLHLQMQEPLPLYFLTRTATGHRTYVETALPLSRVPSFSAPETGQSLHGRATPRPE